MTWRANGVHGRIFSGKAMIAIPFHASATSPSSVDKAAGFTYTWNFGDGTTGSGASPSHTYAKPGKYAVTVSSDLNGGLQTTATATAYVTAPLAPAIAITGMPAFGYSPEGTTLTLDSSLRGTTAGMSYTETWYVWKGTTVFASSTAGSIRFTPDDAAYSPISLTVTDQFGTAVTKGLGLYVYDTPPVVTLPTLFAVGAGSPVTFTRHSQRPGPRCRGRLPLPLVLRRRYDQQRRRAQPHLCQEWHLLRKTGRVQCGRPRSPRPARLPKLATRCPHTSAARLPSAKGQLPPRSCSQPVRRQRRLHLQLRLQQRRHLRDHRQHEPTATIPESYLDDGPSTLVVHGRITDSAGGYTDYTATINDHQRRTDAEHHAPRGRRHRHRPRPSGSATDPSTADTNAGFTYAWNFGDGSDRHRRQPQPHLRQGRHLHGHADRHRQGRRRRHHQRLGHRRAPCPPHLQRPVVGDRGDHHRQGHASPAPTGGSGGYTYSYDFNNDGTFEITGSTSATATIPESYLDDGRRRCVVHGRITDSPAATPTTRPPSPSPTCAPTPSITPPPPWMPAMAATFTAFGDRPEHRGHQGRLHLRLELRRRQHRSPAPAPATPTPRPAPTRSR